MAQTSRSLQTVQQSFTEAIKKHRHNVCNGAPCIHLSTDGIEQNIPEPKAEPFLDTDCNTPSNTLVFVVVLISHSNRLQIQFDFAIPYSRPRMRASLSVMFTIRLSTSNLLTELPVTVSSIYIRFLVSILIISL